MCACMCMRTHTHTHTHERMRMHIHAHRCACTHTHTRQGSCLTCFSSASGLGSCISVSHSKLCFTAAVSRSHQTECGVGHFPGPCRQTLSLFFAKPLLKRQTQYSSKCPSFWICLITSLLGALLCFSAPYKINFRWRLHEVSRPLHSRRHHRWCDCILPSNWDLTPREQCTHQLRVSWLRFPRHGVKCFPS